MYTLNDTYECNFGKLIMLPESKLPVFLCRTCVCEQHEVSHIIYRTPQVYALFDSS